VQTRPSISDSSGTAAFTVFCTSYRCHRFTLGLIGNTTILEFSEFARRITENGSGGTDHGEGGLMMAIGGNVRGGIYGTAPDLNPYAGNPTLSNSNGDVKWDIDFRSVYARILDNWLGADSVPILGGDFRNAGLNFI